LGPPGGGLFFWVWVAFWNLPSNNSKAPSSLFWRQAFVSPEKNEKNRKKKPCSICMAFFFKEKRLPTRGGTSRLAQL
jgi:hypothetical protein